MGWGPQRNNPPCAREQPAQASCPPHCHCEPPEAAKQSPTNTGARPQRPFPLQQEIAARAAPPRNDRVTPSPSGGGLGWGQRPCSPLVIAKSPTNTGARPQRPFPLQQEIAAGAAPPRNDKSRALVHCQRSRRQYLARIEPPFRIEACLDSALDSDLHVTQRLPHKRSFERADAVFAR